MLTIDNQKEIVIDRLLSAMNRAKNIAKISRELRLYDKAIKYYAIAGAYKKSIGMINIINSNEGNNLSFESFPFIKTS